MTVRHALLALLSDGPKYGLQLRHEFEARTGEVWPLNVGQVYTTLQRLERDGLVAVRRRDDGPQKGYEITGVGRDELLAWLQHPARRRPAATRRAAHQGARRGRGARRRRARGDPGPPPPPGRADAALHDGEGRRRRQDDVALALVVDAELFRIEAAVRWLDSAEVRLRQHPTIGAPSTRTANTVVEAARRSAAGALR